MPNFNVIDSDRTILVSDAQYAGLLERIDKQATGGDERAKQILSKLPAGPFDEVDWRLIFDAIDAWAQEQQANDTVGSGLLDLREEIATHLDLRTKTSH